MTEMIRMLAVTPDGELRDHVSPHGDDRTILLALYEAIGCHYVDVVRLGEFDMWVDDEGLITGAVINPLASYVATRFGMPYQLYVGTAVFTGPADRHGGTTSLTPEARNVITSVIAELPKDMDKRDQAVDLDNTSRCPKGDRCDWCDRREWLEVVTLVSGVGVFCKTVCSVCLLRTPVGMPPTLDVGEAMAWVGAHCEHLGIDLDQMHAALREQGGGGE